MSARKTTREGRQAITAASLELEASFYAVRFSEGKIDSLHVNEANFRRLLLLGLMVLESPESKGHIKINFHEEVVKRVDGFFEPFEVKRLRCTVMRDVPRHGENNDSCPPPPVREKPKKGKVGGKRGFGFNGANP